MDMYERVRSAERFSIHEFPDTDICVITDTHNGNVRIGICSPKSLAKLASMATPAINLLMETIGFMESLNDIMTEEQRKTLGILMLHTALVCARSLGREVELMETLAGVVKKGDVKP